MIGEWLTAFFFFGYSSQFRREAFFYRLRYSPTTRPALPGTPASSASAFNLLFISGEIGI